MSTSDTTTSESRSALRCAECDAGLAHDQRYCVECGARRGPLPPEIAGLVGAIRAQGPEPDLPAGTPLADSLAADDRRPPAFGLAMPGPRPAAAAVMAMLGFGVIVGSLVGGTSVATLASAPLIVVGIGPPNDDARGADGGGSAGRVWQRRGWRLGGRRRQRRSGGPDRRASVRVADDVPDDDHRDRHDLGWRERPPAGQARVHDRSVGSRLHPVVRRLERTISSGALRRQGELVEQLLRGRGCTARERDRAGQRPGADRRRPRPTVRVFTRIKPAGKGPRGQVIGIGCEYPASTQTLAGQLTSAGDTWKAYVQGVPSSAKSACRVPKPAARCLRPQVQERVPGLAQPVPVLPLR